LRADTDVGDDEEPTMLALGALRMCIIRRGDRVGVRTWHTAAPALADFAGIPHFAVDSAWRRKARLEPIEPQRTIAVPDVLGDASEQPCAGVVRFEVDRRVHRLEGLAGGSGGELWLVFGDLTNGVETYAGGRFLYTDAPDTMGNVIVDFNRAYNPPCVFSPYATCPLPWPANRLPIRIEAGERLWQSPGS
jgi:uncharacterized protein